MSPTCSKSETKEPKDGKLELQVDSGVLTTSLQLVSKEERRNCSGSKSMEKSPAELVVAVEITFPAPHCNCTTASAKNIQRVYHHATV